MRQIRHEPAVQGCRAIASLLLESDLSAEDEPAALVAQRRWMLQDLVQKSASVVDVEKAIVLAQGFYAALPAEVRRTLPVDPEGLRALRELPRLLRVDVDVAVVTVIEVERDAVFRVFGNFVDQSAPLRFGADKYWCGSLRRYELPDISFVVTNIGGAGNVKSALAVNRLLQQFSPSVVLLCGVAAGPSDRVSIGDVTTSLRVLNYERARRVIIDGEVVDEPEHEWYTSVDPGVAADLRELSADRVAVRCVEACSGDRAVPLPAPRRAGERHWRPRVREGVLMAGEKLLADGSLNDAIKTLHRKIRGGAMEDAGFAAACGAQHVPWAIFRGISDYGDVDKALEDTRKDDKDKYQPVAAVAAASAAFEFMAECHGRSKRAF